MFYGWGRKSKNWTMSDGKDLILTYNYFSLMFIFQIAFKKKWLVAGRDRAQDQELTRDQVEAMYGPDTPKLGLWSSYGIFITIGVLIVASIIINLIQGDIV